MKVEINIPDGWERDTSEFPEHYWPAEDMMRVYVPFRRKIKLEDWMIAIDKGEFKDPSANGCKGLLIPPGWTAREYKGWKYYTKPGIEGETK